MKHKPEAVLLAQDLKKALEDFQALARLLSKELGGTKHYGKSQTVLHQADLLSEHLTALLDQVTAEEK